MNYLRLALSDIAASPNVVKKALQLALISLIPLIGPIFAYGYLFGWARDAAWGVSTPLPESVFSDDDKTLVRGFCALAIALVIQTVSLLSRQLYRGFDMYAHYTVLRFGYLRLIHSCFDAVAYVLLFAVSICCLILFMICALRMSIYSRLTPGFQLGRIAALARRDPDGLIGLFCAACLVVGCAIVLVIILTSFFLVFQLGIGVRLFGFDRVIAMAVSADFSSFVLSGSWFEANMIYPSLSLFASAVYAFAVSLVALAVRAVLIRATGLWFAQFQVSEWKGQDDPYPFEVQS